MTDSDTLARAFKALSHPNRLAIYHEFVSYWEQGREASVDQVPAGCLLAEGIKRLNIGAPTVSHHIKELVDAGLITTSRQGRQMFCAIDPKMRERLRTFFESPAKP
ncbi:helix-turn-helix transcriptional regulator [Alcanivorax sp. 1008]|uniref:ArsR/SmtB family transcription factor n=1 Tax=Alcanivorax sp. 1008 TaxID=2816853 RepID=UPI001DB7606D|nr:metalloregulator ArsR/SmtB family transcription factor [Alcanivorax sp. 1008]MCC1495408.1 winged helix-turn-helix transcriptional regulator [Alcanivorax sp. 1008]